MVSLENTLQVIKVNLKIAFLNSTLLALLLLGFTPIVFSISNLDPMSAARICEQYIALIGAILLVPIFSPEDEGSIRETVETKSINQLYVYFIRILIAVLIITALISLETLLFIMCGGSFNSGALIAGTLASAIFLGALGLFIVSISRQLMAGYMVPIVYFIFDMMTKGRYTKDFFLFSLMNNSFREKYYLLSAAVILAAMSLMVYMARRSWR